MDRGRQRMERQWGRVRTGWTGLGCGGDGQGRAAAGMDVGRSVGGGVVPGIVGAVEEVLDDLVGGDDVDLIYVVNGGPRGDGEGG